MQGLLYLEVRDTLKDLDVDGMVILKMKLKEIAWGS
jgi:hypothetical protein